MIKYKCLNPIAQRGLDLFTDKYAETESIDEADAVLVRSASMHDTDLPGSLLAIARAGAGVNNIPIEECAKKGIVVFNTPGANANGVKELVLTGMLLSCRDITGGISWVGEHRNDPDIPKSVEKNKKAFAGTEIKGKTLGVIGLGAIGVRVANAAVALGMKVLGYDPYLSVNAAWNVSTLVKHVERADEIYRECDYITIHVPLLPDTEGMISKEAIDSMKKTAVVLNFSRDVLVDEKAMVEALNQGRIAKYVVDFPNKLTAGVKNCIATPHLGASTAESEINCAVMAVEELKDYLENGNIKNSVNYPNCDMSVCTTAGRVALFHKNEKNLIGAYTSILGDAGINIANMTNKSRGDYAYTLLDLDTPLTDKIKAKLISHDAVIRLRSIC